MSKTGNNAFKAAKSCTGGACVEVATSDGGVLVRDGKDRDGDVLAFGLAEWMTFIDAIRSESVGRS